MISARGLYTGIMAVTTWGRGERLCCCSYARLVEAMRFLYAESAEIMCFPRKTTRPFHNYKALGLRILLVSISRNLACWLDKRLKIISVPKLTSLCLLGSIHLKKKMDLSGSLFRVTQVLTRDVKFICHFPYSPEYLWYLKTKKIKRVVLCSSPFSLFSVYLSSF